MAVSTAGVGGASKALHSLSWQSLPSEGNSGPLVASHLLRVRRGGAAARVSSQRARRSPSAQRSSLLARIFRFRFLLAYHTVPFRVATGQSCQTGFGEHPQLRPSEASPLVFYGITSLSDIVHNCPCRNHVITRWQSKSCSQTSTKPGNSLPDPLQKPRIELHVMKHT